MSANIRLVGSDFDEVTVDLEFRLSDQETLPVRIYVNGVGYRQTNVFIPGRRDDDGRRRQVYLNDGEGELTDDEVVDMMTDLGGEAGGA